MIADRHYNRQAIGSAQFVPPGRCLVLLTEAGDALWVTSWPLAEYVQHEWAGAWMNSCFRNEGEQLSSDLIRAAVAATLAEWPAAPDLGMVSFVDPRKVRHKRDPGRCYRKAGFKLVGTTKGVATRMADAPRRDARPVAMFGAAVGDGRMSNGGSERGAIPTNRGSNPMEVAA